MAIKKLVDQDALTVLANGINTIIKNKVKAETDRATGKETELNTAITNIPTTDIENNKQAIESINDEKTGILAKANSNTQDKVDILTNSINTVDGKVASNTNDIAGIKEVNTSQSSKITTLETQIGTKSSEGVEATGIYKDIDDLNSSLSNIDMSGAINEAKSYTDQKITDLVNGADQSLDTLKELGDALANEGNAVATLTTTVSGKADKTHTHASSEVTGLSTVATTNSYSDLDNKPTLADFKYENPMYSDIHTLQDAMDTLLYVAPSIKSLSANPNGGTFEIGHTITTPITFNWSLNKTVTSQSLSNVSGLSSTDRSATYTGSSFSSNKTFTLNVSDGKNSASRSVSYTFKHYRYWGVATEPGTYNSAFILGLINKEFCDGRTKSSFSQTIGEGKYFFYCYPASYGDAVFNVGGFDGGVSKVATIDFTNASGNTTSFFIYKSDNANLGKQNFVVK